MMNLTFEHTRNHFFKRKPEFIQPLLNTLPNMKLYVASKSVKIKEINDHLKKLEANTTITKSVKF